MAFDTIEALPLLIVIFFAFIIPIIISKIKRVSIPVVVGELIVGLVIGASGFNIIPHNDPWLEFLRFLGFAFLMFLAGIETDFEHLLHPEIKRSIQEKLEEHYIDITFSEKEKAQIPSEEKLDKVSKPDRFLIKYIKKKASKHRIHRHWNFSNLELSNKPYAIGMVSYLCTLILALLFMLLLAFIHQPLNYFFLGIMFSTTSVGIVFPILYELKLSDTDYGQAILIVSIIADFVSMILITILAAVYSSGIAMELLLIPIIFLVFISCFQFMKILKKHPKWYSKLIIKETTTTDLKVTASIFLLLTFVILSEIFGIEMILGAFIAGIIFSLITPHKKSKELHEKLHAIGYGFTIPIFFIMVGVQMRIEELFLNWNSVIIGVILLGVAFFIKIVPTWLLYRKKFGAKKCLASGLLQSSRLSLIIASASIGYFLGLISKIIFESVILIAIITSTISPIIFTHLMKKRNEQSG
ncbi:MAG: cation:proton antiporter [Promethearchaeota archaeon]|nr:MAG: cation:proton antiporter [Candidatus Lokiarchaeota archaeon]